MLLILEMQTDLRVLALLFKVNLSMTSQTKMTLIRKNKLQIQGKIVHKKQWIREKQKLMGGRMTTEDIQEIGRQIIRDKYQQRDKINPQDTRKTIEIDRGLTRGKISIEEKETLETNQGTGILININMQKILMKKVEDHLADALHRRNKARYLF